ncbi:MAG: hypothetical protein Q7U44_10740, partial [Desulfuromonadales bacterium]|nr:hypothetical protein [Desulfuromonadales bacterium]
GGVVDDDGAGAVISHGGSPEIKSPAIERSRGDVARVPATLPEGSLIISLAQAVPRKHRTV